MVKFLSFQKISLPSDLASNITSMLKFWLAWVLSVQRYRRKRATDISELVNGDTPSKSKVRTFTETWTKTDFDRFTP